MKVKAAVLREFNKPLSIETLELAPPGPGEILVKYVNTGWCNSDLHFMSGASGPVPLPMVLGHETAGIVEALGTGVTEFQKGDHVIAPWMAYCGRCPECVTGRTNVCRTSLGSMLNGTLPKGGIRLTDSGGNPVRIEIFVGGFSTHQVIDAQAAVKIPKELPLEQACFLGCAVPSGWGAVTNKANVKPGESVAVFGVGGVGLNAIRAAAMRQANPIIAVDIEGHNEAKALEFGATHFIDSSKEDPIVSIQLLTGGAKQSDGTVLGGGCNVVIEAIGDAGAYEQAFWAMGISGRLISVGLVPVDQIVRIPMAFLSLQDKSIIGSLYGSINTHLDIPRYAELALKGQLKVDKLITKHFKLEEINDVAEAMKRREIQGRWVCDLD